MVIIFLMLRSVVNSICSENQLKIFVVLKVLWLVGVATFGANPSFEVATTLMTEF